jgi:hypothetical protein
MKQEYIIKFIKPQRLRWAAHIMRMEKNKKCHKNNRMIPYKKKTSWETQVKVDGPGRRISKEDDDYWLE